MENMWDFRGGPGVRTLLPLQGMWVGSLVGELGSGLPCSTAKGKKKKGDSITSNKWN